MFQKWLPIRTLLSEIAERRLCPIFHTTRVSKRRKARLKVARQETGIPVTPGFWRKRGGGTAGLAGRNEHESRQGRLNSIFVVDQRVALQEHLPFLDEAPFGVSLLLLEDVV